MSRAPGAGASRVPPETELARIRPVVCGLVAEGIPVSIDTTRAAVAALDFGAIMSTASWHSPGATSPPAP